MFSETGVDTTECSADVNGATEAGDSVHSRVGQCVSGVFCRPEQVGYFVCGSVDGPDVMFVEESSNSVCHVFDVG